MDERGESSSSHQFFSNEFVYAPVTPAKLGQPEQPDPNTMTKNWLQNPFDEVFLEETSVMRSFNCWNDGFGSTSQSYNINGEFGSTSQRYNINGGFGSTSQSYNMNGGMCNMFSMDDVETWSISCQDLLAIADAGIKKGHDYFAFFVVSLLSDLGECIWLTFSFCVYCRWAVELVI